MSFEIGSKQAQEWEVCKQLCGRSSECQGVSVQNVRTSVLTIRRGGKGEGENELFERELRKAGRLSSEDM